MFEIIVCPIKQLYILAEDGDMRDVAVLAASSYDVDHTKLSAFEHKLWLHFNDVTSSLGHNAFSEDAASQIAAFIQTLPNDLDTLFVCCDSGISRSSAIAAAIMRLHQDDEMKIWSDPHYHPNILVYQLLCSALGCPVDKDEIAERVQINERAFSDVVND